MRISEALGKTIVAADSGEKVGQVDDVLIDAAQHQVMGLLITEGLMSKQRIVPFSEVQTVGQDAVIVRTATTIADAREWLAQGRAANRSRDLHGKDVITSEGMRLGTVHDVIVDPHTGHLSGLELTTSRRIGRTRQQIFDITREVRLTGDVVVMPHAAVQDGRDDIAADDGPPMA